MTAPVSETFIHFYLFFNKIPYNYALNNKSLLGIEIEKPGGGFVKSALCSGMTLIGI